jgi:hypothetical protein
MAPPPTQAIFCVSLAVLFLVFLFALANDDWKKERTYRPENGHDRAALREEEWYRWYHKRDHENIPAGSPLSEGKSLHEGLSERVAQPH